MNNARKASTTRQRRRKRTFFNPNEIKTEISLALSCDLDSSTQEYTMNPDAASLLSLRMEREFLKKYSDPLSDQSALEDITYEKFLAVNEHMANFGKDFIVFPHGLTRPQSNTPMMDSILHRARALMHFVLTPFQDEEWFQHCKHGTGSSLGVSYSDTSLEAKSTFPITMTESVATLMDSYLLFDSQLNSALLCFNEAIPTGRRYEIVRGSRATTVEKSDKIRRMIAVEPTGNMFFQQGLMSMMYERMASVGLDVARLPSQHVQRARAASVTSKEATIDWSSASDCVSSELLRWLLPPKWFRCCELVRSPEMAIRGHFVELNMFSTMGNAVTFPLETLVFWTLAHAVRLHRQGTCSSFPEWNELKTCSVFGDDCILPTPDAPLFIEAATRVGFIINDEKSFYDDKGFRESCGGDFLHGDDVRPFHLKAPSSVRLSALEPWLYIIANSFIKKYRTYFGELTYVYDKEVFRSIALLFSRYNIAIKLVPDYFPDDAGLKISDDINRFIYNYPMITLSKVAVSEHGLYSFLFCRFNYRQSKRRVDDLHYASWLKMPGGRRAPFWTSRKKGGYVVARAWSCHWHFDPVNYR